MPSNSAALEGLRVLELTHSTFNYASKLLAGFGAEVVKIEPPGGDSIRHQPPFQNDKPTPETSGRHLHMNTGKKSVVLDLDNAADVARFRALVPAYDIVIESRGAGYMAARGLGYDDLRKLRPDLIMTSISHFGQTGPYSSYQGAEIVAELERLSGNFGQQVTPALFRSLADKAGPAGGAVPILDAGLKKFPAEAAEFESAIAKIQEAGDPAATEQLRALGYIQ